MTNSRVLNTEFLQIMLVQEYLLRVFSAQVIGHPQSSMDL